MQNRDQIFANPYYATSRWGFDFFRIMLQWQGSVFKLIWLDVVIFLVVYFSLAACYNNIFIYDPVLRETFEIICVYCSRFSKLIPVTFMTGFYVSNVVSRYWDQFLSLPWPDKMALKVVSFIPGKDDYHRTVRRTLMRYVNLSTLLVFRLVSVKVRKRFSTYQSLVDAGLLLSNECALLESMESKTPYEITWAPLLWAVNLLQRERNEGRLKLEPPVFTTLVTSFEYIDSCNRRIFNHAWVNFPLAYTQVANLTVYAYVFSSLFSQQFLQPHDIEENKAAFNHINIGYSSYEPFKLHTPAIYFPWFTIFEFIGYMGWIKVAVTHLNPWGDDDEDFQVNYLIDRNFQTSFLIVDEGYAETDLLPDIFMSNAAPTELPYPNPKSKPKLPRIPGTKQLRHFHKSKKHIVVDVNKLAKKNKGKNDPNSFDHDDPDELMLAPFETNEKSLDPADSTKA